MGGVSASEFLLITLVILVVFGPRRLPALARKLGRLVRDLRGYASELRAGIEAEIDATDPDTELSRARRRDTEPPPPGDPPA
ncbi:MAG TPA: twin-arginine translocase TatA/TatE family subunit [Acidimicrobiia bacterium]|nr:twin-arginine translocase TatA/TatE family subunit [Acidimicrobiia bacterium]